MSQVEYYFERLEYYKKLRKAKGYNASDFANAQADVKKRLKK